MPARWSAMCKLVAGDTAMRVTTDAVQVLGGYGYIDEFPVERMMRDAKITQLYEGTQQIQRLVIARALARPKRLTRPVRPRAITGAPVVHIVVLVEAGPGSRLGRRAARPGRPPRSGGRRRRSSTATTSTRSRPPSSSPRPHGGEVTLLSMAPANAPETMRKALAMGATRGVLVTDPALAGSDARLDGARPRRGAQGRSSSTSCSPASTRPTALAGVVPAGVAALLGLPYLSYAAKIEPDPAAGTVRVRRISPTGYDVLEAPMPALDRLHPGARRAALPVAQGDHGRPLEGDRDRSLADLGVDAATVGGGGRDDEGARVASHRRRAPRRASSARRAGRGRARDRRVPRRAEDHLMARPVGRRRGDRRRDARQASRPRSRRSPGRWPQAAGSDVTGVVVAARPDGRPRRSWRRYRAARPRGHGAGRRRRGRGRWSPPTGSRGLLEADREGDSSSSARGRTAATSPARSSALTGRGVLANATAARWADGGPIVEMSVFGGKLITTSAFTGDGGDRHGPAERRDGRARSRAAGKVEDVDGDGRPRRCRRSRSSSGSSEAGAAAPIEEARIIVAGGRGVGGPDGFKLVEELAEALGGAVGATRAAVDCGLDPVRPADRPDRQDRQAAALPRARDQRRDPAQGRDADRRRRSSRSTATRTRRSPSSRTCSSSATCSRSVRRSSPSSAARLRLTRRPRATDDGAGGRSSLPLVAFLALAAGLLVVFRRTGRIARATTREVERFRRQVARPRRPGRRRRSAAIGGRIDAVRRAPAGRRRDRRRPRRVARRRRALRATRRGRSGRRATAQAIRDELVAELERAGGRSDGRARLRDHARRSGPGAASSRPRPRSSAATSTSSTPGRRSPATRGGRGARPATPSRRPPDRDRRRARPRSTTPCSGILGLHHKLLWCDRPGEPMRCPQCGERETRVVDSRDLDDAATIRRRRECAACTTRFTTYERVEAARLVVVKRDGTRQEFDRDKLASGPAQGADPPARPGRRRRSRPPTRSRPSCAPAGVDRGALVADRRARDGAAPRASTRSPTSGSPASTRASRTSRSSSARSTRSTQRDAATRRERSTPDVSVLSDRDIRAALEAGEVGIDPYDPADLQPSSVDLHLDRSFRVFRNNRYAVHRRPRAAAGPDRAR